MNKALKAIAKADSANFRKALNIATDLRRLFQNERDYFALGGSLALRWMNLLDRSIGDVDIMVSDKAKSFITFAEKYHELTGTMIVGSGSGSPDANDELDVKQHIKINVKGKDVCIFVMAHKDFLKLTGKYKSITVAKPSYIRKAKEVYLTRVKNEDTYKKHQKDIEFMDKKIKELFERITLS